VCKSERWSAMNTPASDLDNDKNQTPQQRIDELEQALERRDELLATVSHELRTPMGAIISMADLLIGTDLSSTQRHYAETLKHSALGLVTILNDILDHSKLEAGRFELAMSDFDPQSVVRAATSAYQAACAEKGVALKLKIAPDLPAQLKGDPGRIRQVLMNLIDNAVKFTDEGSITITLDHEASDGDGGVLTFSVQDTGIGLDEKTRELLFKPFAQGRPDTARDYGGTGLGLSIAARLVGLMGGKIHCEGEPGAGTAFTFTVACAAPGGTQVRNEEGAGDTGGTSRGPAHILVVEDNKINAMLITTYLEKFGHSFDVARNGQEAVEAAGRRRYDLILMDVQMPRMDGLEATGAIRALGGEAAATPIVALTANVMHGDRDAYLAAGMDGYISKPIIAGDLFTTIEEFLADRSDRAKARA